MNDLTVFGAEDGEGVANLPEKVKEGEPDYYSQAYPCMALLGNCKQTGTGINNLSFLGLRANRLITIDGSRGNFT